MKTIIENIENLVYLVYNKHDKVLIGYRFHKSKITGEVEDPSNHLQKLSFWKNLHSNISAIAIICTILFVSYSLWNLVAPESKIRSLAVLISVVLLSFVLLEEERTNKQAVKIEYFIESKEVPPIPISHEEFLKLYNHFSKENNLKYEEIKNAISSLD